MPPGCLSGWRLLGHVVGGLRSDRGSVYPITAPGLGINITDDFLRKYKFDERRTEEMEQKTFNTAK